MSIYEYLSQYLKEIISADLFTDVQILRIGMPSQTQQRPRPLRMVFQSEEKARSFQNVFLEKKNPAFLILKDLWLTTDKTKSQLDEVAGIEDPAGNSPSKWRARFEAHLSKGSPNDPKIGYGCHSSDLLSSQSDGNTMSHSEAIAPPLASPPPSTCRNQTSPAVESQLTIYYQNVRGIRTKLDSLRTTIPLFSCDLFAFTETWLFAGVFTPEIGFSDHDVFRCDRSVSTSNYSRGGGVLLAVRRNLRCSQINTRNSTIEHVCVKFKLHSELIIIGNFYIPPYASIHQYTEMCQILEDLVFLFPLAKIIVLGDFNMPYAI